MTYPFHAVMTFRLVANGFWNSAILSEYPESSFQGDAEVTPLTGLALPSLIRREKTDGQLPNNG